MDTQWGISFRKRIPTLAKKTKRGFYLFPKFYELKNLILIMRIKFPIGKQREFIEKVLIQLGCPSLRRLREHGFTSSYSCLKNYYNEYRTLPQELFNDFCVVLKINPKSLNVNFLEDNWGKVKGGKK